jgi:hypothetical protein
MSVIQQPPMTESYMNEIALFLEKVRLLDVGPIAYQLMLSKTGPKWTKAKTVKAIARYLRFLYLVNHYPLLQLAPSREIDEVWHQHILDTSKYVADCQMLFGRLVHHFPYFGVRDEQDHHALLQAHALTQVLYRKHFGEELGAEGGERNADCEPVMMMDAPADCEALLSEVSSTIGCAALRSSYGQRPRVDINVVEALQNLHSKPSMNSKTAVHVHA